MASAGVPHRTRDRGAQGGRQRVYDIGRQHFGRSAVGLQDFCPRQRRARALEGFPDPQVTVQVQQMAYGGVGQQVLQVGA